MKHRLTTAEAWAPHVEWFEELDRRLRSAAWFNNGWVTHYRHNAVGNRVIFLLYKESWFNGAIYFKTRITNTDIDKNLIRVGLHVETSVPKHGINRATFCRLLLQESGNLLQKWEGYVTKPGHHQKPFHTWIPFTPGSDVSGIEAEFSRVQQLGTIIDQSIEGAKATP